MVLIVTSELIAGLIGFIGMLGAAGWALFTYSQSVKLQRARWVKELYEKFYERGDLKVIRDLLDSGNSKQISELVGTEPASFTDYLNFFEFLAFLSETKQIEDKEILGLFEYYLRILRKNSEVSEYISDPTKGFEKLHKLLDRLPLSENRA